MNGLVSNSVTADPNEVSFFNNFGEQWWTRNLPLHYFNSLRVPLIRDGLIDTGFVKEQYINSPKPFEGLRILDVGCGG